MSFTPLDYHRVPSLDDILFGPDPRWWMELFCKIPTQNGLEPFVLWPWMNEVAESGVTNRELMLKSREIGSSTFWVAEKLRKLLTHPGSTLLIAANKEDNARNLMKYAKAMIRNLPDQLRPKITADNQTEVELGELGCLIKAMSGTATSGRAERAKYLICTEQAFWGADGKTNPEEYWVAMTGALVEGGEIAIESTANTQADLFHEMWVDPENGYRKHFYPWSANPTHHPEWYAQRRKEITDTFLFLRDYPTTAAEAFTSASDSYFDSDTLIQGKSYIRPPIDTRQIGLYGHTPGQILVWKRPVPGRHYVIGADVAEGRKTSRDRPDWSSACVLDARSYEHVASVHCRLPDDEFARVLVGVAQEYNQGQLAIERNNFGMAVIRVVQAYGYNNLFHQTVQLRAEGRDTTVEEIGWATTHARKASMYSDLYQVMKSGDLLSGDAGFWDEAQDIDRGTLRAMNGHDDRVMAMGIAVGAAKLYRPSFSDTLFDKIRTRPPNSWSKLWTPRGSPGSVR